MQSDGRKALDQEVQQLIDEANGHEAWDNERCNKWALDAQSRLKVAGFPKERLKEFQAPAAARRIITGFVGAQRTVPPLTVHATRVEAQVKVLKEFLLTSQEPEAPEKGRP